ncbi:MAG: macro domain-containing protein [Elusimicrobiales bacterium]|nr:macro domain-containing protein [Elusimicrobiales bacterium]
MGELVIKKGDITLEVGDAIVNAANSKLAGGGGVDGAIHKAAGPKLSEKCREIISKIGYLKPGEAVITPAYNIKNVKYIIHTVGPIWRGGKSGEEDILRKAYANCLLIASQNSIKTISFPSISTGAYGYPIEKAAYVAIDVLEKSIDFFEEIRIVLFSDMDYIIYEKVYRNR